MTAFWRLYIQDMSKLDANRYRDGMNLLQAFFKEREK